METLRDAAIVFALLINAPLIARWAFMLPAVLRAEEERKRMEHEASLTWAQVELAKVELELIWWAKMKKQEENNDVPPS